MLKVLNQYFTYLLFDKIDASRLFLSLLSIKNQFNMEVTIKQNLANILSTLTILSCLFLKVPQIMYIREKCSAEGIYMQAMIMEVVGFSIMTLYNYTNNYSIMTYMEYPIILLQVYVMFYYCLKFKDMLCMPEVTIAATAYVATVIGFATTVLPKTILSYVVPFCTPLSGFAKVTYIYGIIREKNADAVSLTTWVISVLTNLARIFTVYVDSADFKLMTNFFISALLSSAVLGTAIYYKRKYCAPRRPRRKCNSRRGSHSD